MTRSKQYVIGELLVIVAMSAGLPFVVGLSPMAFSSQFLLVTKKTEMGREKNSPMAEETAPCVPRRLR
jgi:hypothetical protein